MHSKSILTSRFHHTERWKPLSASPIRARPEVDLLHGTAVLSLLNWCSQSHAG